MNPRTCADVRRDLLRRGPTPPSATHMEDCRECAAFARSLVTVDRALADEAAAERPLPDFLRDRILRASQPTPAPRRRRGVIVEFALRVASVAAVLAAMAVALPEEVAAAELPVLDVEALGAAVAESFAGRPWEMTVDPSAYSLPFPDAVNLMPLALACVALGAVGLFVLRREGTR